MFDFNPIYIIRIYQSTYIFLCFSVFFEKYVETVHKNVKICLQVVSISVITFFLVSTLLSFLKTPHL